MFVTPSEQNRGKRRNGRIKVKELKRTQIPRKTSNQTELPVLKINSSIKNKKKKTKKKKIKRDNERVWEREE